ncbi:MAG: polymer-forming cytoskeletal protein [Chloroflexota bacterium]|nr:polymer-forming cytoskeletal protein [Chloroflexota bacterium]
MSIRTANRNDYATTEDDDALFAEGPSTDDDTFSVVDRHSAFDGTFRADRDLRIEGEVKGTIECQGTLFVAQGATVTAKVEAENITVAGDLNGEIRCRGRLQMMPSGRVRGTVSTETLVVNEGAYYEGQLEMAAPEDRGNRSPRSLPAGGASPVPMSPSSEGRGGESRGGSATFIRRLGSSETAWDSRPDGQDGERRDDEPDRRSES